MSRLFFIFCLVFIVVVVIRLLFFSFPLKIADGENVHFTATIFDDPKILGSNQQVKVLYENF